MYEQFKEIGRDIFLRGLISSHAGNMSARVVDRIYITRKSSMLGKLQQKDVIELELGKDDPQAQMASSELVVHTAIYRNTSALAIIHAHPPYATLLSMLKDEIVPVDTEGLYLFKRAPVVSPAKTIGSEESAAFVSEQLKENKIVIIKGHGSFARGETLEEAFMYTSSLESSCFFLWNLHIAGR
ncbi:MAG: L-fuculose-phosphate aldolase [Deltaproteobacteria bacterium]|nr:L-fuculose-phosphate aldolase [Deltaproteobacteria bacterium]